MNDSNSMKTASGMVADAKARIQNLNPMQVSEALRRGATLVDIREMEERKKEGTIEAAVYAPRGMLEFYADPTSTYHRPEFYPDKQIILHCASGGRSALAADMLQQMGYRNVAHLDGGFKAWKEQGQPVQTLP
ncbi:Rhodanese-related sulfurtransferase [Noviherbaspirillum humi]|uniref:Rhodanese-related sulfurtransferase n=1 Tax=Noviherbaspirillum humi TaxID=1688639 RepID=A0A239IIV3_9BURK|nr:rhodanese-like domain-containing protein [Noviherbaspirillum humi]SNS93580.1 Rhodanese-related sulfurtransferase [Noviherbaspirillum humi]